MKRGVPWREVSPEAERVPWREGPPLKRGVPWRERCPLKQRGSPEERCPLKQRGSPEERCPLKRGVTWRQVSPEERCPMKRGVPWREVSPKENSNIFLHNFWEGWGGGTCMCTTRKHYLIIHEPQCDKLSQRSYHLHVYQSTKYTESPYTYIWSLFCLAIKPCIYCSILELCSIFPNLHNVINMAPVLKMLTINYVKTHTYWLDRALKFM